MVIWWMLEEVLMFCWKWLPAKVKKYFFMGMLDERSLTAVPVLWAVT